MSRRFTKTVSLLVAALLLAVAPLQAEDFLLSRKFYGYALLGVGGWCFKEAYDARQNANDFREQYRDAGTDLRAQELFDDNKRYDTRTVLMLSLGAGSLFYAVHLLRSGPKEELPPPDLDAGLMQVKGLKVDVRGDFLRRGIDLRLTKDLGGEAR
jgi:hypothetical protein